jgi:hypothetical protein
MHNAEVKTMFILAYKQFCFYGTYVHFPACPMSRTVHMIAVKFGIKSLYQNSTLWISFQCV